MHPPALDGSRIVHVLTQEEPGGAQRVAVQLCRAHRRLGIASEVWFLYRKQAAFAGEPGLRTLAMRRPGPLGLPPLLARLRRDLAAFRPTAVVAHTHWSNFLVPPVARSLGVPRRLAVLHCPVDVLPWPSRLAEHGGVLHRSATALVAVSPSVARSCPGWFHPTVIANAVPPRPAADGGAMRRSLGLEPGIPLAVNVGRLAAQKGQVDLLHLLARLPRLHVAIAGEGPLRGELGRLAEELGVSGRLHLLGALPASGVSELLAAADVFLLPSRFEGLSLALLEAMQAGLPIVASDVESNHDAVGSGPGAASLLVAPGDIAGLAAAVTSVLDDPARRQELMARARRQAALFSEEAMVDAWHRLLGVTA